MPYLELKQSETFQRVNIIGSLGEASQRVNVILNESEESRHPERNDGALNVAYSLASLVMLRFFAKAQNASYPLRDFVPLKANISDLLTNLTQN